MFHPRSLVLPALVAGSLLVACAGDDADDTALPRAEHAQAAAADLVQGEALAAERVEEDGFDLWEVAVEMPNGAELETVLFVEDGALFEVKDEAGPFDYDSLDPLPGHLTYAEARDLAFDKVQGEQVAWEVKFSEDKYFYEFYVEEISGQLWEVKLWSDTGEVFVVEAKDAVD